METVSGGYGSLPNRVEMDGVQVIDISKETFWAVLRVEDDVYAG